MDICDLASSGKILERSIIECIEDSIRACRRDLVVAASTLKKLLALPSDNRVERIWESVWGVIQHRDIRDLDEYLHRHVSHLYMKITLIEKRG